MGDQEQPSQKKPKYGTKIPHDSSWKGPVEDKDRNLTDFVFLILFIFYLVFWIYVSVYVLHKYEQDEDYIAQYLHAAHPKLYKLYEIWHDESNVEIRYKIVWSLVLLAFMTALLSFGVMIGLHFAAIYLTWIAIIITCSMLLYLAYSNLNKYNQSVNNERTSHQNHHSGTFLLYAILSMVSLLSTIVLAILYRKKINVAAEFVRHGSIAAFHYRTIYLLPVVEAVINSTAFVATLIVAGAVFLEIEYSLNAEMENAETKVLLLYFFGFVNIVGMFWFMNCISATSILIMARSFSVWYWTRDKSEATELVVLHSFYTIFRFHLGTAALGSLLLTIFKGLAYLIQGMRQIVLGHRFQTPNICFTSCYDVVSWLEIVMKYINGYSYIFCAVHGTNFFRSATQAFNLIRRSAAITLPSMLATTCVVYSYQAMIVVIIEEMSFHVTLLPEDSYTVTGLFAVIISSSIFSVLKVSTETIVLSALEDMERNDGGWLRPYYMDDEIKSVLLKE